jgi:phosphoribosylanthranilate isomerase
MFHVKICGVTSAHDARLVIDAGADAIGLNFVPGSLRRIDAEAARAIRAAVPAEVVLVGVFAGTPVGEIRRIAVTAGLDAIQLHGHLSGDSAGSAGPVDPPDRCLALAPLPVIRAVRLEPVAAPGDPLGSARAWVEAARRSGCPPVMTIIDATVSRGAAGGRLGGTGDVVDWPTLAAAPSLDVPMGLAGGLTPENVAAAIAATGLSAVDTASGVESAPGCKDPGKVRAFVASARRAMGL